ncbi:hypothetical protein EYF80_012358 [Liparis tanakae]|uniref:Uncharacterized protein n=1 Tax=Liparis tanakae TaxID=230148 RepID=A0A4Z2IIX2_9TELE|nr:hypothetical protein EYF80_012358 [Liparis tanakae]
MWERDMVRLPSREKNCIINRSSSGIVGSVSLKKVATESENGLGNALTMGSVILQMAPFNRWTDSSISFKAWYILSVTPDEIFPAQASEAEELAPRDANLVDVGALPVVETTPRGQHQHPVIPLLPQSLHQGGHADKDISPQIEALRLAVGHLSVRLDAVFQTVELPTGVPHLDTSLADVHRDAFTLDGKKRS